MPARTFPGNDGTVPILEELDGLDRTSTVPTKNKRWVGLAHRALMSPLPVGDVRRANHRFFRERVLVGLAVNRPN